jgi:2-methylcitrate dehydratase
MESKSVVAREAEPALWEPTNRETADHSGPYLIAAALVDGVITEDTFEPDRFQASDVLAVTDTIELIEDPDYTSSFPWQMACRFELRFKDGREMTMVGVNPKGHPLNPMSDDEFAAKFLGQAEPLLGGCQSTELLQTLRKLEGEPSLERVFALMIPAS